MPLAEDGSIELRHSSLRALSRCLIALTVSLHAALACAQDAGALLAQHRVMRDALAASPFKQPLLLQSRQNDSSLQGDAYAVVALPFATVSAAFQGMDRWCDITMLHLNVKECLPSGPGAGNTLTLAVARKYDQPLADAYRVEFAYSVVAATRDYVAVQLKADKGPLSTKHYVIMLEAVALTANSSFVHLSYSYASGMAARAAMQLYLSTMGRGKIGFTVLERKPDGTPVYISDARSVIERNTMRYYLAIEAYLGSLSLPAAQQREKRLRDWFAATERFAPQLRELDRDTYLTMKRREIERLSGAGAGNSTGNSGK